MFGMTSEVTRKHRRTLRRYENLNEVRFLTFSCYQRYQLFNDDAVKQTFVDQIDLTQKRLHFKLIAWVIMPEHTHFLLVPNLKVAEMPRILKAMKIPFATKMLNDWRQAKADMMAMLTDSEGDQHYWQQGGGYDRNIHSAEEYEEKFNYIHANPVRRGLAVSPTDWQWSSARFYAGMTYDGPKITPYV